MIGAEGKGDMLIGCKGQEGHFDWMPADLREQSRCWGKGLEQILPGLPVSAEKNVGQPPSPQKIINQSTNNIK